MRSIRPRKDDIPAQRRDADALNFHAAKIIAAEPERYPGAMQEYASRVLERLKDYEPAPVKQPRKGQTRMF